MTMTMQNAGVDDRPVTDYIDVETDDNGNSGVDDSPVTDYIDVETDDNDNAECRCWWQTWHTTSRLDPAL